MAKNEFDIGQMIGGLGASIESLKEAMTRQHGEITAQISMTMVGQKEIEKTLTIVDKNATKAHDRIDDQSATLVHIKDIATRALELSEDYHETKKKAIFGAGILISIGAFLKWAFT
jgi:hypothetical protein